MASRFSRLLLAAAFLVLPAALPAAPYLVKDLNTAPATEHSGVFPADRGTGQGVTYFVGGDPAHGLELWRSDGTPGGTGRLTDICAGRCDGLPPYYLPAAITVHAGRVYFRANDGFSGDELWVSDGTPGSERRVRDVCPGPCSAVPSRVEEVGDRLLFVSHLPAQPDRFELRRTDGTRDGTVRVKALCSASAADCTLSSGLLPIGGRALFLVSPRPEELELWVTDGTAAGTRSLREPGSAIPLTPFDPSVLPGDGFAWVWASDGLWRSDGTAAGTSRLKRTGELTAEPGAAAYLYRDVLWHGLYFGFLGEGEIIRSDGTPEGTFRAATISSDTGSSIVRSFALLDSELLLLVDDSSGSDALWGTRGTADTTGPRLELETGGTASLASLGGDRALFLWSSYGSSEARLSVTDGTAAGTRQLAVAAGNLPEEGEVLFSTGDGRAFFLSAPTPNDLWITDGTEAGTQRVRSFGSAPGSSGPMEQAAFGDALGDRLVFSALEHRQPFVSDGTAAGTGPLSEVAYNAFSFFRLGQRLLFSAAKAERNPTLWETDGTPAGTVQVTRRTEVSRPARLGGQILFTGFSLETGDELWKTDSLTRTFNLVKDINPFTFDYEIGLSHLCLPESSLPVPAGVVGGRLLFAADDGRFGPELWASDGTKAGTVLLKDINPGRTPGTPTPCYIGSYGPDRHDTGLSSDPQGFVLLGSIALFAADDGVRGRELRVTNGTFPGTRRLADLVPGPRGSAPHDLVRIEKRVYFLAGNSSQGESLWSTDGTARGTTRVLDLTLDGQPSWGRGLTVASGRLFFTVYNEATGAELWTSAGLLTDLNPGPGSSAPQSLTVLGGTLLFAADDGLTGLEPWRTDGTAAGTVRVSDINPGRDASSPGPFTAIQDLVMTGADDGVHGRELWAIPRIEIVQPPE